MQFFVFLPWDRSSILNVIYVRNNKARLCNTIFSQKKILFHSWKAWSDHERHSFWCEVLCKNTDLCFSVKVFWMSHHRSLWHWNWFITLQRISPVDFHSSTSSLAGCITHYRAVSCIQYTETLMTEVWLWKLFFLLDHKLQICLATT